LRILSKAIGSKKKYKILMVAPTSFFAHYGAHVRILEEIWALQGLGHRVTVVTYGSGNDVPGVDIRRAVFTGHREVSIGSSKRKMLYDPMLFLRTLRAAWALRPDIIHAHLHEGALIGRLTRSLYPARHVPVIFDYQGSLSAEMVDHRFIRADGRFYKPFRALEQVIDRMADAIIASSHNAASQLRTEHHVNPARIFTIADGVDVQRFAPPNTNEQRAKVDALRAELGIPVARRVIVYLGKLAPYQGTDLLLEAARLLLPSHPDTHFLIMGYPAADDYRRLADYLGIGDHVTISGRVPYDQAPNYLALGEIAVAPKLSTTEGAGKIANYMAMALPTVCFDTPTSREFLAELGYYALRGSAPSLADCLSEALNTDPAALRERGLALRHHAMVERSWSAIARNIVSVYDQARAGDFTVRRSLTTTLPLLALLLFLTGFLYFSVVTPCTFCYTGR
jgi:glycosyltransferase involved in cell wall biosynthesis